MYEIILYVLTDDANQSQIFFLNLLCLILVHWRESTEKKIKEKEKTGRAD